MKKIGVLANCAKQRSTDVLRQLSGLAATLGLELVADEPAASLLGCAAAVTGSRMLDAVDVVMALGGDGTMLRAVRELDGRDIPLIGVNIGGLGFLTSVSESQMGEALRCLAEDDYELSVVATAECVVERAAGGTTCYIALNDVVVSRGASGRVVNLGVSVDGARVTSYVCDGVIVATPAGSTGYALSAGGPILTPGTPAFVISVICPHTLSSRPLVVPDRSEICIVGESEQESPVLSVDGQLDVKLACGDCVRVTRSKASVRFVHLPGHSYYGVLREKLGWSGSSLAQGRREGV